MSWGSWLWRNLYVHQSGLGLGGAGAQVAADAGGRLLLTDVVHPDLSWRGLRMLNALAADRDPLLSQLLARRTLRCPGCWIQ